MWTLTIYHNFDNTINKLFKELDSLNNKEEIEETSEELFNNEHLDNYWKENFNSLEEILRSNYQYNIIKNPKTFIINFESNTDNKAINKANNKEENNILLIKNLLNNYYYQLVDNKEDNIKVSNKNSDIGKKNINNKERINNNKKQVSNNQTNSSNQENSQQLTKFYKQIDTFSYLKLLNNLDNNSLELLLKNSDYLTKYLIYNQKNIKNNNVSKVKENIKKIIDNLNKNHFIIKDIIEYAIITNIYQKYITKKTENYKYDYLEFKKIYADLQSNKKLLFSKFISDKEREDILEKLNKLPFMNYPTPEIVGSL